MIPIRYKARQSVRLKALKALIVLVCIFTLFITGFFTGFRNTNDKFVGTLLFHNYTSYDSWDGQLYTLDLSTKKLSNLTDSWQDVKHTINGSFSHDGSHITFMGSQSGIEDWDIYVTTWNGATWSEPVNLTGPNNKRDEDPKFSPTENRIIYKEDGVLATIQFKNDKPEAPIYLTSKKTESSMPYFLPNGRDYLFESAGEIYLNQDSQELKMYSGEGLSSYYPIALDDKKFIYTRVQNSRHDAIMLGYYDGRKSLSYFFNNDQWDNSDPYPYQDGSGYLFLVSGDYIAPNGGYNLVIADLKAKKMINIDTLFGAVNTDLEELGPNWSPRSFS